MSELELLFKYLDAMGTLKVCAKDTYRTEMILSGRACVCFSRPVAQNGTITCATSTGVRNTIARETAQTA